jgi:hypothetical protein
MLMLSVGYIWFVQTNIDWINDARNHPGWTSGDFDLRERRQVYAFACYPYVCAGYLHLMTQVVMPIMTYLEVPIMVSSAPHDWMYRMAWQLVSCELLLFFITKLYVSWEMWRGVRYNGIWLVATSNLLLHLGVLMCIDSIHMLPTLMINAVYNCASEEA